MGHAVKPSGQTFFLADRRRLPRQYQEGRLEGVLGIVFAAEKLPANAQHQRAVSLNQGSEGNLVALLCEAGTVWEELAGQASRRLKALQSGFLQAVAFIAQVFDVLHLLEHDPHDVRKIHAGTLVAGLLGLGRWQPRGGRY